MYLSCTVFETSSYAVAKKPAPRAAPQQMAKFLNNHVTITTPLLWVICHPIARVDIAYLCTQFDDFRRFSEMIGVQNFLMGHMT